MALNIDQIVKDWKIDEPQYNKLGEVVVRFIKSHINEQEILPEVSSRTKDLLSIIKKIKKKQLKKDYSYTDLKDKLGVRLICTFQEDMNKIDEFLKKYFIIVGADYKQSQLSFDKLDYISNHYDVSINTSVPFFKSYASFQQLVFEIQVRTLNQHAWSNSAHYLAYKQEAAIDDILKRKVYRLLSLYEIADDEFSSVNDALTKAPNNLAYTLLRKLEGKIYKFARVDYDRDISIMTIKLLLAYFNDEQKMRIVQEIEKFIETNNNKIQRIFEENRVRYHEIPFLTQPEIFLAWFALENFPYSLSDNWATDFDMEEYEMICNLWGKSID